MFSHLHYGNPAGHKCVCIKYHSPNIVCTHCTVSSLQKTSVIDSSFLLQDYYYNNYSTLPSVVSEELQSPFKLGILLLTELLLNAFIHTRVSLTTQ